MERNDYDLICKLVIVGDSGVGKTSFLSKFCDRYFPEEHFTTISPTFKNKIIKVQDKKINLQIWDMPGYGSLGEKIKTYIIGAHGIILMYDVTDENSFNNIRNWITQIENYLEYGVCIILVGNKSDKLDEIITEKEGKTLADEFNMSFFESSAKNTDNVDEVFNSITNEILNKRAKQVMSPD